MGGGLMRDAPGGARAGAGARMRGLIIIIIFFKKSE